MCRIGKIFRRFLRDTSGATAIEYGLISAMMGIAAIAAFTQLGDGLVNLFGVTDEGAGGAIRDAASSANL